MQELEAAPALNASGDEKRLEGGENHEEDGPPVCFSLFSLLFRLFWIVKPLL